MYQKYLKYKKKYLELKKMIGGLSQYVKLDNYTYSFQYAMKTNKTVQKFNQDNYDYYTCKNNECSYIPTAFKIKNKLYAPIYEIGNYKFEFNKQITQLDKKDKDIIIYGPVSYYYFKIKDKKILLFGDRHTEFDPINVPKNKDGSNPMFVLDYIKKLIEYNKNSGNCLDFFMEYPYFTHRIPIKQYAGSGKIMTIDVIRNYFYDNYPEYKEVKFTKYINPESSVSEAKGFRYHTWDLGQNVIENYEIPFHPIWSEEIKNIDDIPDLTNLYIFFIGHNQHELYSKGEKKYFELKDKIIKDLKKKGEELINDLNLKITQKKIWKQLENIDTKYFTKEQLINHYLKLIENKELFNKMNLNIRLLITETYTIGRMFRKFEKKYRIPRCDYKEKSLKNIIYFGGNLHTLNIVNFFKNLGWNPNEYQNNSPDPLSDADKWVTLKRFNYFN